MSSNSDISRSKRLVAYVKDPKNALPLKFVLFCFGAGATSVHPFLVLQMKLIGFSIKEIALIFLAVPLGSFLGPIVSGIIADKFGKYNFVCAVNFCLTMISFNLFLSIPHLKLPTTRLSWNEDSAYSFEIPNCGPCMKTAINSTLFTFKNCKTAENLTNPSSISKDAILAIQKFDGSGLRHDGCHFNIVNDVVDSNFSVNWPKDALCEIKSSSVCYEDLKPPYSNSFIAFLVIDFMVNFFLSAAFTMTDAAVLAFSRKYNLELGKQKAVMIIGFALGPMFSGFLIDYHSRLIGETSYFALFMVSTFMISIAVIVMTFLTIEMPMDDGNMWKNSKKLFKELDIVLFFIILLSFGVNFGFIESYLFIFLKSLGATGFFLGLTLSIGNLASVPLVIYADQVENKLGQQNVFLITFACYSIRLAGYSFMVNPWIGLIFEALEAFTYELFWVTSMKIFPILAPRGLLATMTGLSGAIHFCLGKGVGGFLGGQIIDFAGIRVAFRIMSLVSLGGGIFYLIVNKLVLSKSLEQKEKRLKEEEEEAKCKEMVSLLEHNKK